MKSIFQAMEDEVIKVWEDKVLIGLKIWLDCENIVEDLTNKNVGYCFLNDDCNHCFKEWDQLLRAVLHNEETWMRSTRLYASQDHLIWNRDALQNWLKDYAAFESIQLARVEMLSGAAGWGTEITAMNLWSTEAWAIHNLLIMGHHIVTLHTYHKSGNLSGLDKRIPPSLNALTSDLVIQDLALARPFAESAVHLCFPGDAKLCSLYRDQLFVDYLKSFTTDVLSATMISFSMPIIGFLWGSMLTGISTFLEAKALSRGNKSSGEQQWLGNSGHIAVRPLQANQE
jgi:hypothetical protein